MSENTNQPLAIHLKDYQEPNFTINSVELTFELFEAYSIVKSNMKITKLNKNATTLELNSIDLELERLSIDDIEVDTSNYTYENEMLSIVNIPHEFTLKIQNKIYPAQNTELEGLYLSSGIYCTQNEPEGFRRITPYLDKPDTLSVFTTTIIADATKYPLLLSNGNKASKLIKLADNRHSMTWHDPHPKPSYLFALVAGKLGVVSDAFTTLSGNEIELNIYCDLGNESKCHHAMKSLKEAMVWDEEKYGCEYDLDIYNIVAVDSFNMGAMENKGLNIFNTSAVLADADVATDENFMRIQSIIAHEYFHNWTGNRVTCKNWFQLTLKEGLTVFRDQCFSADLNSSDVQRIDEVKGLRASQFVEDASPTAHPIQPKSYISINNFYTATVYEKGAEVIRMVHTLLGEEAYRKATDLYFKTFDGQAVTTKDFLWSMQEASGHDLSHFELWYDQSGTPTVEVTDSYEKGNYTITFKQVIPNAVDGTVQKPYYFPFKIGLIDAQGEEILEKVLILSKEEERFSFDNLNEKPHLSLNRDFSAPVIVVYKNANHTFSMEHDQNSFARYDTTQKFGIETIEKLMQGEELDQNFVDAYGKVLELNIDLSYKALLLELPSVTTLTQRQTPVDFELIEEAKEKLSIAIAKAHKEKLLALYHEHHHPKSGIEADDIAERKIKNICLTRLAALDEKKIIELAQTQYVDSLSMSDRIVALNIVENSTKHYEEYELQHFYIKYQENTLVMNKYLAIKATSSREGVLQRVMELQNDTVYDIKVPNLVRSLIGAFAGNYQYFHAKDGSGYKFMADKIIEIDKINAQIASRLAGAFKLYKKMNSVNQALMKVELERVINTEGLSKNSFEILDKILKG
ncbi:MAG: Membrane alanine aminopeptidase N (EC [uncultured Sulfurovum sp.]|uniref:Aminopeptidase N n=1 Tax=uncultured Sulfurovum sp. TaxID=269237 RepID=A0A6S6TSF9_9BACT|nr:MAG: Membrane alanine aminopeptidase N (EC [uncultured Sulfurovum sp.]